MTEHFLRNANLPVIRRTADTELAVADAINIEKEVADRSNSKLVYLNLCSQELLHRSNNKKSNGATDIIPQVSSAVPTDRSEQNTEDDLSTDSAVQMALKNAGLLSDSPPCSPSENREASDNDVDPSEPDNILELDSQPEMDIYGDFEYDLEDEDYIGTGARGLNAQEEENESKMKLIFSTMNLKDSDSVLDCIERLENNEVPRDPSCSSNHDGAANMDPAVNAETSSKHDGAGNTDPAVNAETGNPPSDAHPSEPCDAECDELYGPEKEPLLKKFPNEEFTTLHGDGKSGLTTDQAVNTSESGNDKLANNMPVSVIADNSSNATDISENLQKRGEKKSETAVEQSDNTNHIMRKVVGG